MPDIPMDVVDFDMWYKEHIVEIGTGEIDLTDLPPRTLSRSSWRFEYDQNRLLNRIAAGKVVIVE